MVIASKAVSTTIALLIVFGGVGLLVNGLIVYAIVTALGERRQNQQYRSPQ